MVREKAERLPILGHQPEDGVRENILALIASRVAGGASGMDG